MPSDPPVERLVGGPAPGFDALFCAREAIHIPGAIQPHGAMLAVRADGLIVSHASANLSAILGRTVESVLGRPLAAAIGAPACKALLEDGSSGGVVRGQVHFLSGPDGSTLYLQAFRSGRHICVDIEPMHFAPRNRLPIIKAQAVLKTFEHATTGAELCELAVYGLKAITGYDRVMAYRFAEDGHGEVIAEACEAHLEPYLGLHYPAADIPLQARQLYLRQRVGAIADSNYTPEPLLSDRTLDDGAPLDLTHSTLRSVSPVHREYMRNMRTAASLTVGLAHGPGLWGMLVCHHATARVAGPELRAAADMIGRVVSLLLSSIGEAEVAAQRLARSETLRAVIDRIANPLPLLDALATAQTELLRLVDATGVMVRYAGAQVFLGRTPPAAVAEQALAITRREAGERVLALDDLCRRHPELAAGASDACGALLLPLGQDSDDAILWFRPELARTVTWAGDPTLHGSVDPATAQISPRRSFAAWEEQVGGRSLPWTELDLVLAGELRAAVQTEVARRTTAALRESEARLGLLVEHSGDVVILLDADGSRRYVSPAVTRLLGWRPEEMVGSTALIGSAPADFVHPEDQKSLVDARTGMARSASGERTTIFRHRCRDGSWRWVEARASLRVGTDAEDAKEIVVTLRDATERKTAESKLLEALERMEQMAASDGLTGLANRRHFDLVAEREWRRCARDREPLSALLLDADRFKRFNDRYGHLAGDECLRALASRLAAVARRPGDVAARYGGEEFVLLLPATGLDGATAVAQKLCRVIRELELPHEGNTGFGVVTSSIGVATAIPGNPASAYDSMATLLSAADAALYRAKSGGRNQVAVAEGRESAA